jgi:mTERF domain-containing protein
MLTAVRRRLLPLPPDALAAAFSSSTTADPKVSYLISRCGLSPAAAARAAPSVRGAFPGAAAQADAVLALFRRYGFSDADISSTIRKLPVLLASDPSQTLQPKLDFLASVGVSAPLLPRLISLSPIILHRSVEDHLAPLFATLREVLGGSDDRVVAAFRQMPFLVRCQPKTTLLRGLPLLRDVHGMSADEVAYLVALQPAVLMQTPDRINEIVEGVRNAGLEAGCPMFVHAFAMFSKLKPATLESKITCYRSLGFDKDSVTQLIRRYPASMSISEKKIAGIVGLLTGKAGLSLEDIVAYPTMLVRSLEAHSRRCSVLLVLRRAGKQQGQYRLPPALVCSKSRFLRVYVLPHASELPDVLRAINGEIPFNGFSGSKEKPQAARKKMSA